jgi:carbon storage regulator
MLVLTRRPEEGIWLGEDICIRIVAIKGNQVRIAIDAPSTVKILRTELLDLTETVQKQLTHKHY